MSSQSRTTLIQVAERAGVSPTTASLVLGGKASKHRISEETFDRVQRAAQELDYAPNLLVRSMQRGRTHILSFFNGFRHRDANDLYMDQLSAAIERAAGKRGYDILVHCNFERTAEETYRFLNGGRADGLILFAPPENDPLLPYLLTSRLPTVLINGCETSRTLPCVKDDLEQGMRQVVAQLIATGHRRIAAITEFPGRNRDAVLRVTALQTLLAEHNIIVPERWIVPAHSRADQKAALRFLLSEPEPPTVLFCWHDYVGYVILDLCETMGIHVPEQLSLVGYDGICWPTITRHVLSSVYVDLDMLAQAAVMALDRRISGKEEPFQAVPVQFIRGTTLAARQDP